MAIDTEGTCWLENTYAGTGDGLAPTHDNFTVAVWWKMNEDPAFPKDGAIAWPDNEGWYLYGQFLKNKVALVRSDAGGPAVTETIQCDDGGFGNSLIGLWRHIILRVEHNPSTSEWEMRLYVNGIENGTMRHWDEDEQVVYPSTKTLWIGRATVVGGYSYHDCSIESFAFWERALSLSEISFLANSRLMDAPLMIDNAQLQYFCRFDETAPNLSLDGKDYYPHVVSGRHPFEYGGGSGGIGDGSYLSRCTGHDLVAYGPAPRSVLLDAAALAGAVPNVAVVPGAISSSVNAASLVSAAGNVSVIPGATAVLLSPAQLTSSAPNVIIIPGATTVPVNAATAGLSAEQVIPVGGPVTVALAAAVLSGSAGTVAIQPGSVSVLLNAAALSASPATVTVIPGAVTVALGVAASELSAGSIITLPGGVTIAVDAVALAASAEAVSTLPGAVTIGVESASLEAAAAAVSVRGGLIILPDGRGIKVALEDRMLLVKLEDRLIAVPTEEKIISGTSEDRIAATPQEDRETRVQ